MRKTTKIIICLICVAVAAACVAAGYLGTRGNGGETTTSSTAEPVIVDPTTTAPPSEEETTENADAALAELLIGKWTDSAGMSGFEFFEDGKASFTYANLATLGISFDGKIENGTYTLEGNTLTVAYSIYTATIDKKYEISIENDVLKMKDLEELETVTFVRSGTNGTEDTSTTAGVSVSDELYGSWENTSMSKKYKFQSGGKVTITLDGEAFSGVYVSEGSSITIQYTAYGKKITEKFTFAVTTTALTLTNEAGSSFVFKRAGTTAETASDEDLLGLWRDSANMSGYEFKENGVAEITYVNVVIPVLNVPINGTFTGAYELEGEQLTLTYYIYGKQITDVFTYKISGNSLKLTSEDSKTSTYIKQ